MAYLASWGKGYARTLFDYIPSFRKSVVSASVHHKPNRHTLNAAANMEPGQTKLWIDCDAGVDDAQGLLMATSQPGCEMLGVSCVAGNVGVDQVTRNVLRVLTLCGRSEVPVYVGCGEPLVAQPIEPNWWFGRDGLGDAPWARPTDRDVEMCAQPGHAAVKLVECAREHEGQLTVVALGPLTNIALACKIDPSLPFRLKRLVVMGSSEAVGNASPTAEYNFYMDPEAAQVVLQQFAGAVSGGRPCSLLIVSWECTERHPLPWYKVDGWCAKQTTRARFMAAISEKCISAAKSSPSGSMGGWECADPLAVAVALRPNLIVETKQVYCRVETQGSSLTRGQSVYDWNNVLKQQPNVCLVKVIAMDEVLSWMEYSLE